jgi:hypothetical protein
MQVEKVERAVVGFEHSQVLRAEMLVRLLAGEDRKQKRQVGVVRIQQIQLAEVERIVARHGGEIGVQFVIGFRKQIPVRGPIQVLDGSCWKGHERPLRQDQRGRSVPQEVGEAMWLWVSTSLSCTECTEKTEVAIAA